MRDQGLKVSKRFVSFAFYISHSFGKRTGAAEAVLNVENSAGECCFCFFTKAMDPSLLIQS